MMVQCGVLPQNPPDLQDEAVKTVLRQAELLAGADQCRRGLDWLAVMRGKNKVLESVLLAITTEVAKTGIGWWRESRTRKQAEEEWVSAPATTLDWVTSQGFPAGQDGWNAVSGLFRETDFISTWSVPGARAASTSLGLLATRGQMADRPLIKF